ncbi:MAG: aminotransferase class I/II-fold pyridoxal phosphate-dependent enzyme [Treponema sp.]|nr:aminotransferase class I/II-fold pyridoxal phosphate-dependent enzyme [Treponema sp.]
MLNPLAQDLNDILKNTAVDTLFSKLGKRMFFPKGIIMQSGEAKRSATVANGTIGMTVINGSPAILPSIQKSIPSLNAQELVAYAPTAGNEELRALWKNHIIAKNPLLASKAISLPTVVPGLTAGIAYAADLFCDETKPLLVPYPSWDNYALVIETRCGAELHQFPLFDGNSLNISGLEKAVNDEATKYGSVRLLLNFPQNPSGYSPTHKEIEKICSIIKNTAEHDAKLLIICDDAYFGLNYEPEVEKQSLFAHIADIHENVLAVKIDGPTKEDFAWGFRCGFMTFGCKNYTKEQYNALEKKLMGLIRATVSCSSTPAQSLLLRTEENQEDKAQRAAFRAVLEKRYRAVRNFVNTHTSPVLTPLPFNSGYFMSFHVEKTDAEDLRKKLLAEKGIGTIAIDSSTLRIAFSSIDEKKITAVYAAIYETALQIAC